MTNTTLLLPNEVLLRQIDARHFDEETRAVSSSAFVPRPTDEGYLSVDRESIWTCRESYQWYSKNFSCPPAGTTGLLVSECIETGAAEGDELPALAAPIVGANPAHASIDFTRFSKSKMKKLGKILKFKAQARGWLYPPELVGTGWGA